MSSFKTAVKKASTLQRAASSLSGTLMKRRTVAFSSDDPGDASPSGGSGLRRAASFAAPTTDDTFKSPVEQRSQAQSMVGAGGGFSISPEAYKTMERARQLRRDKDRLPDAVAAYRHAAELMTASAGHPYSLGGARIQMSLAETAVEAGQLQVALAAYEMAWFGFECSGNGTELEASSEAKRGMIYCINTLVQGLGNTPLQQNSSFGSSPNLGGSTSILSLSGSFSGSRSPSHRNGATGGGGDPGTALSDSSRSNEGSADGDSPELPNEMKKVMWTRKGTRLAYRLILEHPVLSGKKVPDNKDEEAAQLKQLLPVLNALAAFAHSLGRLDLARTALKKNIDIKTKQGLPLGPAPRYLATLEQSLAANDEDPQQKLLIRRRWELDDSQFDEENARDELQLEEFKAWAAICRLQRASLAAATQSQGDPPAQVIRKLLDGGQAAIRAKQPTEAHSYLLNAMNILYSRIELYAEQENLKKLNGGPEAAKVSAKPELDSIEKILPELNWESYRALHVAFATSLTMIQQESMKGTKEYRKAMAAAAFHYQSMLTQTEQRNKQKRLIGQLTPQEETAECTLLTQLGVMALNLELYDSSLQLLRRCRIARAKLKDDGANANEEKYIAILEKLCQKKDLELATLAAEEVETASRATIPSGNATLAGAKALLAAGRQALSQKSLDEAEGNLNLAWATMEREANHDPLIRSSVEYRTLLNALGATHFSIGLSLGRSHPEFLQRNRMALPFYTQYLDLLMQAKSSSTSPSRPGSSQASRLDATDGGVSPSRSVSPLVPGDSSPAPAAPAAEAPSKKEDLLIAGAHFNLALCLYNLERYEWATNQFNAARAIRVKIGEPTEQVDKNLAALRAKIAAILPENIETILRLKVLQPEETCELYIAHLVEAEEIEREAVLLHEPYLFEAMEIEKVAILRKNRLAHVVQRNWRYRVAAQLMGKKEDHYVKLMAASRIEGFARARQSLALYRWKAKRHQELLACLTLQRRYRGNEAKLELAQKVAQFKKEEATDTIQRFQRRNLSIAEVLRKKRIAAEKEAIRCIQALHYRRTANDYIATKKREAAMKAAVLTIQSSKRRNDAVWIVRGRMKEAARREAIKCIAAAYRRTVAVEVIESRKYEAAKLASARVMQSFRRKVVAVLLMDRKAKEVARRKAILCIQSRQRHAEAARLVREKAELVKRKAAIASIKGAVEKSHALNRIAQLKRQAAKKKVTAHVQWVARQTAAFDALRFKKREMSLRLASKVLQGKSRQRVAVSWVLWKKRQAELNAASLILQSRARSRLGKLHMALEVRTRQTKAIQRISRAHAAELDWRHKIEEFRRSMMLQMLQALVRVKERHRRNALVSVVQAHLRARQSEFFVSAVAEYRIKKLLRERYAKAVVGPIGSSLRNAARIYYVSDFDSKRNQERIERHRFAQATQAARANHEDRSKFVTQPILLEPLPTTLLPPKPNPLIESRRRLEKIDYLPEVKAMRQLHQPQRSPNRTSSPSPIRSEGREPSQSQSHGTTHTASPSPPNRKKGRSTLPPVPGAKRTTATPSQSEKSAETEPSSDDLAAARKRVREAGDCLMKLEPQPGLKGSSAGIGVALPPCRRLVAGSRPLHNFTASILDVLRQVRGTGKEGKSKN